MVAVWSQVHTFLSLFCIVILGIKSSKCKIIYIPYACITAKVSENNNLDVSISYAKRGISRKNNLMCERVLFYFQDFR